MIKRVIIGSGPTIEPIDPVRFISNRSSGKSGYYLAQEATRRNIDEIIFVTGPSRYIPEGVTVVNVETAQQMQASILAKYGKAGVVIMAAAVSDYRVANYQPQKIKKGEERLTLELERNPDILLGLGKQKKESQVLVGYAAETHDIFANGRKKFERKNLDLLVLNEISPANPAFDVEENQVHFLTDDGYRQIPKMKKQELSALIWDEIFAIIETKKDRER